MEILSGYPDSNPDFVQFFLKKVFFIRDLADRDAGKLGTVGIRDRANTFEVIDKLILYNRTYKNHVKFTIHRVIFSKLFVFIVFFLFLCHYA